MINESILSSRFMGVATLVGKRGSGKTWLASQFENPELTVMLNFDGDKGNAIENQLHFGEFHNVINESFKAGGGPLGLWKAFDSAVANLPQDKFTVAIIDNGSPLELALKAEAARDTARYVKDYGLNLANVLAGRFGGLNAVVNGLIPDKICIPLHSKGIKLIIVTFHIKPKWSTGGIVFNKYTAKGADRWQELSILTLVLTSGTFPPVPSAIVQKEQLGTITWNKEEKRFIKQRTLPLRLPLAEVDSIYNYINNPANIKTPRPGEAIVQEEWDMYSDDLSKEQISTWEKSISVAEEMRKADEAEEKETMAAISKDMVDHVKKMKADKMTMPAISKELGIEISEVARYLAM